MKDDIKRKIQQAIVRKNLGERDVAHIMSLCRKYIEQLSDDEKNKLNILKFFCDWTLHHLIDRASSAFEVIKEVNSAIYDLKLIPDNDLIINRITEIVSFSKLRIELKRFFNTIGIEDVLTKSDGSWNKFVNNYIKIVLDVPLLLPEKLKGNLKREILQKPLKEGAWIVGISISAVPQSFFKGSLKPQRKSYLCLTAWVNNTTRIVIPLSPGIIDWNSQS